MMKILLLAFYLARGGIVVEAVPYDTMEACKPAADKRLVELSKDLDEDKIQHIIGVGCAFAK